MRAVNKWPAGGRKIKRKEANCRKLQKNCIILAFLSNLGLKMIKDARRDFARPALAASTTMPSPWPPAASTRKGRGNLAAGTALAATNPGILVNFPVG